MFGLLNHGNLKGVLSVVVGVIYVKFMRRWSVDVSGEGSVPLELPSDPQ